MEMFSGTTVDLIQPDPETIRLDDIAHHIARIHRYTGGTEWSVAAHSLCVAMLVPPQFRLEALLHDAHEAYVGDVSSPMKLAMREVEREIDSLLFCKSAYDLIEECFESVVREKFGLPPEKSEEVHRADMVMLATERRIFLRNSPKAWEGLPEPTTDERVRSYMLRVGWNQLSTWDIEARWLVEVDTEMRKRDPAWGTTTMLESKPRWP